MGRLLFLYRHIFSVISFFIITLTVGSFSMLAQDPFARKITFLEGLPTQTIFDMHVSNSGLLYLGTNKGLVSFDGARFKEYNFGNNLGISVHRIQEDHKGTLWCKNFSNQVFYMEDELLKPFPGVDELFFKSEKNLLDFVVVRNGLLLLTEAELYFISYDGETQILFEIEKESVKNFFTSLVIDPTEENIFLGAIDNIYHLKNHELFKTTKVAKGQKEMLYYNNELFFNTKATVDEVWSLKGGKINAENVISGSYFYNIREVDDEVWLLSSNGAYRIDTQKNSIGKGYFKDKRITDIVKDHEGNLWLATINEGIFMVPSPSLKIVAAPLLNGEKSVDYKSVGFDRQGNIFAGTNNGTVLKMNKEGRILATYNTGFDIEIEFLSVIEDRIFTSIGVFTLQNHKLNARKYYGKHFVPDNRGNLFYATYNSAALISLSLEGVPNLPDFFDADLLREFGADNIFYYPIRNIRARSVHFSEKTASYYVGFNDGLYLYNKDVIEKEIVFPDGSPVIASRIVEDADGTLWISTSQNGLLHLSENQITANYTTTDGLISNQLKRVAVDELGVWVVSDKGLDLLEKNTKRISNVGLNLALKGITINDIAIDDEHVWLATNEGVVFFEKEIAKTEIEPYFEIVKVLVNSKPLSGEEISLKSSENNIEFFFQTRFYRSMGSFEFEYLLEGVDTTWQRQPSVVSQVKYMALQPNQYTFHARIRSGKNTSKIISYFFAIQKPFWQQTWFISIAVITLLLFFFLVYRLAEYKTKKKQRIKELLAQSQLTALRAQMNPHFMFNILNAVQGLIYSNQKTKASEYLGTFSDLVRKTLDNSDKKEVSIEQEIETIRLYINLEKGRFEEDSFFYTIHLPDGEDLSVYNIPSLLIQPFVENAIKHGLLHKKGMKRLEINVEKDNEAQLWRFIIEDNGVGRETSKNINSRIKKHASFATNAIENRIQLINKINKLPVTIKIEDLISIQGEVLGTRVIINIPFKKQE